jgi:hypothetical protein
MVLQWYYSPLAFGVVEAHAEVYEGATVVLQWSNSGATVVLQW